MVRHTFDIRKKLILDVPTKCLMPLVFLLLIVAMQLVAAALAPLTNHASGLGLIGLSVIQALLGIGAIYLVGKFLWFIFDEYKERMDVSAVIEKDLSALDYILPDEKASEIIKKGVKIHRKTFLKDGNLNAAWRKTHFQVRIMLAAYILRTLERTIAVIKFVPNLIGMKEKGKRLSRVRDIWLAKRLSIADLRKKLPGTLMLPRM